MKSIEEISDWTLNLATFLNDVQSKLRLGKLWKSFQTQTLDASSDPMFRNSEKQRSVAGIFIFFV